MGNQQRRCSTKSIIYLESTSEEHVILHFTSARLHVNPSYPHLTATPDGVVSRDCCGGGIMEIKCPYKHCDTHTNNVTDPHYYLKSNEDRELQLSHRKRVFWLHLLDSSWHVYYTMYSSYLSETKSCLDAFFLFLLLLTDHNQSCSEDGHASSHTPMDTDNTNMVQAHSCGDTSHQATSLPPTACLVEKILLEINDCPWQSWLSSGRFHFECLGVTSEPRGTWTALTLTDDRLSNIIDFLFVTCNKLYFITCTLMIKINVL